MPDPIELDPDGAVYDRTVRAEHCILTIPMTGTLDAAQRQRLKTAFKALAMRDLGTLSLRAATLAVEDHELRVAVAGTRRALDHWIAEGLLLGAARRSAELISTPHD